MSLQNRLRLSGRVAIVTGGSRGIGERIALELAQNGAKVSITYTSTGSAAHSDLLVKSINSLGNGSSAIAIKADLRDPASPEKIVAQTIEHFGESIDILVNNAGVELVKPIKDVTVADFGWVYDLNLCWRKAWIQESICLLLFESALEGLTRCWAAELGASGHTVNCVNPGPVQTDLMDNIPKETIEMQRSQTPLQNRIGTVEDIAPVVVWLASEESKWITGQVVSASGGWAMY
ncbi:short-chain dehydrogenase/reductase, putative [Aspergillus fumigatus A1163]|uniref:Short-chain dehydrogenase/reductase, putative n=1 Tax=Aspergillus fumigatus (strain CBS 144.89 / FGSC A1163 / CEA10) TaxID=451804 RepID=B0Y976_ASPFC|nr:short-chain dehydrogenase/reductase, putative [Aspergillus fumigatus A1163]